MKSYTAAGGGLEGAAAVEAANKVRQEGKLDDSDEEEIDMLQDDDDEEDIEDLDEEIEQEINQSKNHLHAIVSPPSSITTTDTIPESIQQQQPQHHTLI